MRVDVGFTPDPSATEVTAGGALEHPACGGFVAARPSLVLTASANVPWLRVYATSGSDVTLAILGPGGQWRCADDTYGTNPSVDGLFRRGTYRVWVGTPTRGATASATVTATAQRAQLPGPVAVPSGGAAQNPLGALTGMAQQVLGGVAQTGGQPSAQTGTQGGPLAVPLATLQRAGLDPNALPAALGAVLRQPDAGVGTLSPASLGQLAELARMGLDAGQLQSVATALSRATTPGGATPALSAAQLGQLAELARAHATPERIQSAVTAMTRAAGAAR